MRTLKKDYFKRHLALFSALSVSVCFWPLLVALSFADTYTVVYQYDASSRLTSVQYSNGTTIEYGYDAAGNILSKKAFSREECSECSGSPVVLTNVTFKSGTVCVCSDDASITIGSGVTIESGANIIFKAPTVKILSGFQAKEGAVVKIQQE